jgi:hypothetical protein
MVVGRVLRATGCPGCRRLILRRFTSLAGSPIRTTHLELVKPKYWVSGTKVRFSSNSAQDNNYGDLQEVCSRSTKAEAEEHMPEDLKDSSVVVAVPWYLEVDSPQRAQQPLSGRQTIPDLPESPPHILQMLLQHISVDLGLDNLCLLDLRKLDPPPALGANLLMLICSARSEKHLHVSADRLCRWLRSTYKLRPDADGLLGRNELKLKLKRKSRRAKLLGSAVDDNGDDGVRTGWVCVDVGVVESSAPLEDPEPQGFIGFGRRADGVRIVVQMLTEEKREEIDLEKLWGGILQRGGQKEIEDFGEEKSTEAVTPAVLSAPVKQSGIGSSRINSQSRGFHTCARSCTRAEGRFLMDALPSPDQLNASVASSANSNLVDIQESVIVSVSTGDFEKAEIHLLQYSKVVPQLQDEKWSLSLLEQLRLCLESTPREKVLEALGETLERRSSPFLKCFYQAISAFPSEVKGQALIWLYCYARELGHKAVTLKAFMKFFSELQLSGIPISAHSYIRLIRSALQPSHIDTDHRILHDSALAIVQAMHDQGHDVLTEDTFLTIQEALAQIDITDSRSIWSVSSDSFDLPSLRMSGARRRLHAFMKVVDIPFFREESRLKLLDIYSRHQHWAEFWDVWRMAPRQGQPQSPAMYAFMFARVAETKHQKGCMTVLRTWIPDMDLEDPKVPLEGDVARAIMAMLKVADPHVKQEAESDAGAKGEWINLWRRCVNGDKAMY